jgi:hypothetical protein
MHTGSTPCSTKERETRWNQLSGSARLPNSGAAEATLPQNTLPYLMRRRADSRPPYEPPKQ